MKPYLLGPVSPDLFSSEGQIKSGGTTTSRYIQYINVSGTQGPDPKVESAWEALVSSLGKKKESDFSAWGVQDTKGFAGIVGWDSLEVIPLIFSQQYRG
jgi:hypothetical protein